jgi:hypothetical protein
MRPTSDTDNHNNTNVKIIRSNYFPCVKSMGQFSILTDTGECQHGEDPKLVQCNLVAQKIGSYSAFYDEML